MSSRAIEQGSRSPLDEIPTNGRVRMRDSVELNNSQLRLLTDRVALPSYAIYGELRSTLTLPFSIVSGLAPGLGADRNDEYWYKRIHHSVDYGHNLDKVIRAMQYEGADEVDIVGVTAELHTNKENYDSTLVDGVTEQQLRSLMDGSCRDFVGFLRAEGQFARLVVTITSHEARLTAFKIWVILVGRFFGPTVMGTCLRSYRSLSALQPEEQACVSLSSKGLMGGFKRYNKVLQQCAMRWLYTVTVMEEVRYEYWGDHCYDVDVCGLHGVACEGFWDELSDDEGCLEWDSTRENTPL